MPELKGVYLLGLRGSGKTALGRCLAEELGMDFADSDLFLERRLGRTAAEILEEGGETALRRAEGEVFAVLGDDLEAGGKVLSLGGGAVESPGVESLLEALRRLGYRGVWLVVAPRVLARRVGRGDVARPRLAGRSLDEEIRLLSARRASLFARLADLRFDNSPDGAASQAKRLAARLFRTSASPASGRRPS